MKHPFFLNAGAWLGEGMVRFQNSDLAYPYTAVWDIKHQAHDTVICKQQLTLSEVEVVHEITITYFDINTKNRTFSVSFANADYGMLVGTGTWNKSNVHLKLIDTDNVKIFEATYDKEVPTIYHVQNTLLLKTGENLLVDGTLVAGELAKT